MRYMRWNWIAVLFVFIIVWAGCEDPQSINNLEVVKNPFIVRVDTLRTITNIQTERDTVAWNTLTRLFVGNLPGYRAGIQFKVLLDSSIIDSIPFDRVWIEFQRDFLFPATPGAPSPATGSLLLSRVNGVTPDPMTSVWGDSVQAVPLSFEDGNDSLLVPLNLDSVFSTLRYDTSKTMTFTLSTARRDFIQRFYSVETSYPPLINYHFTDSDTSEHTVVQYVLSDATVFAWVPQELDTLNYAYVSALGSQKIKFSFRADSLLFDTEHLLQHILSASVIFNPDPTASSIYPENMSTSDTTPRLTLTFKQLEADTCECNRLDFAFYMSDIDSLLNVTSSLTEAVASPDSVISFYVKSHYAGFTPNLLAFPRQALSDSSMWVIINSARVETP